MTIQEILDIIEKNEGRHTVYGIRGSEKRYTVGQKLPCSPNMVDDLYDPDTGRYPSLDGTCATGFGHLWFDGEAEDVETVQKAIDLNKNVYGYSNLYLVAGSGYSYGDDEGEIIIENAEVICEI